MSGSSAAGSAGAVLPTERSGSKVGCLSASLYLGLQVPSAPRPVAAHGPLTRDRAPPPSLPPVLTGHVSSLLPY